MKRFILSMAGAICAFTMGCGDEVIKLPEGRPGSQNVSGALRARSANYQLIGTLSPGGGSRSSTNNQLNDGAFVNKSK